MGLLNSVQDFENYKSELMTSNDSQMSIKVGMGTCGIASGATDLFEILKDRFNDTTVKVNKVGCLGDCYNEPVVEVISNEKIYRFNNVTVDMIDNILENVESGIVTDHSFPGQIRIALENCGIIDPENLEEYVLADGYTALKNVLFSQSSDSASEIIEIIKTSGLRGRGGAGFPAGIKWEATKNAESDTKYVVCNADEGDPGAFMDRAILEGDPHRVIEAMAITGYAIGAKEGIIYIRAEYPLAVERLNMAISAAKEKGLLGDNILGTDFSFDITLSLGAGAFVCGEETALLNSIEGLRGEPRVKPPFPAQKGLYGNPTVINNVETFANICPIIKKGADWFKAIGTEKSPGTKVFALAGKINKVGLIEVPMGTTLREIVYDIGGGVQNEKQFKAVQTGGPSGGCIPLDAIDVKVDFESLTELGAMMGSGGMIVMDEDDCMVDIAKFYIDFSVEESCGKCTPCRVGNLRLHEILTRITEGSGDIADIDILKDLSVIICETSLCGLGQSSPNPVLSTLDHFHDEYVEHVKEHKCRSGKCKSFVKYVILPDVCIGCTLCAKKCPVPCIEGEPKKPYKIIQEKCIKCNVCLEVCPVNAITKDRRKHG